MKDQPSLTAWRVALSRAAHQIFDRPRVLEDTIALAIVGERGVAEIRGTALHYSLLPSRYLRAFLVARSRVTKPLFRATASELKKDSEWLKNLHATSRPRN